MNIQETFKENAIWKITKYANKEEKEKGNSYEEKVIDGNILVNEGIIEE